MNRLDAIDLARAHALAHGQMNGHSYLPTTDAEAADWQPHTWVVDAIVSAAEEREVAALSQAEIAQPPTDTLRDRLQRQCVEMGVYWRASDAHGVDLTTEQATELLCDALGVEVEIKSAPLPLGSDASRDQPDDSVHSVESSSPPAAALGHITGDKP